MNEHFSDLFEAAQSRTVTLHAADGRPLAKAKLLHAAALAAAGVVLAPRLTAAAAVAALVKGIEVSVEGAAEAPPAA